VRRASPFPGANSRDLNLPDKETPMNATTNGTVHGLLTPNESVLALIDYQPQMGMSIESHPRLFVLNNAVLLAKAAKLFKVPVVLTTIAAKTFSGAMLSEVQSVY